MRRARIGGAGGDISRPSSDGRVSIEGSEERCRKTFYRATAGGSGPSIARMLQDVLDYVEWSEKTSLENTYSCTVRE